MRWKKTIMGPPWPPTGLIRLIIRNGGIFLTRAILDTIQEPLVVLDEDLRIIVASKSFYRTFHLTHESTKDILFYNLNDGEWDIAELRELLGQVIAGHSPVEAFEIEHDFKTIGQRTMQLSAREIKYENDQKKMLLSIFDVTERRHLERDKQRLSEQKDTLLKEMRHRIANSLQLIASVLLLKAGNVESEETCRQLEDAYERIISIATVQKQLDPTGMNGKIKVAPYLKGLCESLTKSMIGGRKPITLEVIAGDGEVAPDDAIGLGLITTELVINALKHGFPHGGEGAITVSYESDNVTRKLSVADNGVGIPGEGTKKPEPGLGTSIIGSLAKQLNAAVATESTAKGATISVFSNPLA